MKCLGRFENWTIMKWWFDMKKFLLSNVRAPMECHCKAVSAHWTHFGSSKSRQIGDIAPFDSNSKYVARVSRMILMNHRILMVIWRFRRFSARRHAWFIVAIAMKHFWFTCDLFCFVSLSSTSSSSSSSNSSVQSCCLCSVIGGWFLVLRLAQCAQGKKTCPFAGMNKSSNTEYAACTMHDERQSIDRSVD